ncbi:hypothetical protein D1BOALGB6SA_4863, partial [Olavius sp. associated proteobacterium Delta 1]
TLQKPEGFRGKASEGEGERATPFGLARLPNIYHS